MLFIISQKSFTLIITGTKRYR